MKRFIMKYKHALWIISYMLVYLFWWGRLEQTVTKHFHVIHMAIDNYIPFVEVFIIPYLLWFPYVALTVLVLILKDKREYYKCLAFLATGMTLFLIISTFFPNGHLLRLSTMPRDNAFTRMIAHLWRTDTPTNIWPSIHCYNSIGVHLAILHARPFEKHPLIKAGSLVLCLSIIASTVLIKQHSFFDVITAVILASVMCLIVYRKDLFVIKKTSTDDIIQWVPGSK